MKKNPVSGLLSCWFNKPWTKPQRRAWPVRKPRRLGDHFSAKKIYSKNPLGDLFSAKKINSKNQIGDLFFAKKIAAKIHSFKAGKRSVRLEYNLLFADGFDFVKGGKLPGLYGGHTR